MADYLDQYLPARLRTAGTMPPPPRDYLDMYMPARLRAGAPPPVAPPVPARGALDYAKDFASDYLLKPAQGLLSAGSAAAGGLAGLGAAAFGSDAYQRALDENASGLDIGPGDAYNPLTAMRVAPGPGQVLAEAFAPGEQDSAPARLGKRAGALVGDIALDPLNWATGGLAATSKLGKFARTGERVVGDIAPYLGRIGGGIDEATRAVKAAQNITRGEAAGRAATAALGSASAGTVFLGDVVKGTMQEGQETAQAIREGDWARAAEHGAGALLTAGLGTATLYGVRHDFKTAPRTAPQPGEVGVTRDDADFNLSLKPVPPPAPVLPQVFDQAPPPTFDRTGPTPEPTTVPGFSQAPPPPVWNAPVPQGFEAPQVVGGPNPRPDVDFVAPDAMTPEAVSLSGPEIEAERAALTPDREAMLNAEQRRLYREYRQNRPEVLAARAVERALTTPDRQNEVGPLHDADRKLQDDAPIEADGYRRPRVSMLTDEAKQEALRLAGTLRDGDRVVDIHGDVMVVQGPMLASVDENGVIYRFRDRSGALDPENGALNQIARGRIERARTNAPRLGDRPPDPVPIPPDLATVSPRAAQAAAAVGAVGTPTPERYPGGRGLTEVSTRDGAEVQRLQSMLERIPQGDLGRRLRFYQRERMAESARVIEDEMVRRGQQAQPTKAASTYDQLTPQERTAITTTGLKIGDVNAMTVEKAREFVAPLLNRKAAVPEEAPTPHKFSTTQIDLPPDVARGVQDLAARIPDEDLAGDGRETRAHVTVKYGLHTEDANEVRALLADEGPITVKMGKTSTFPPSESSDGAAVIKVDVDSPDLHRLNAKITKALKTTDSHPDYVPHVTLAYVKPEVAQKYVGDTSLAGQSVTIDRLTFSSKNGEEVVIPLTGDRRSDSVFDRRAEEPSTTVRPKDDRRTRGPEDRRRIAEELQVPEDSVAVDRFLAERQRADEADEIANTDVKTGLKNARGWDRVLKTVNEDTDSVVTIDLKGFKETNDRIGHKAGDEVLASVGGLVRKHFGDESARPGGDEFNAVMRNVGEEGETRAAAFREELRALKVQVKNPVTGELLDIPFMDAHIGIGRDADESDLAQNIARDLYGSGRKAEAGASPGERPPVEGTAREAGPGLGDRPPQLGEPKYSAKPKAPAAPKDDTVAIMRNWLGDESERPSYGEFNVFDRETAELLAGPFKTRSEAEAAATAKGLKFNPSNRAEPKLRAAEKAEIPEGYRIEPGKTPGYWNAIGPDGKTLTSGTSAEQARARLTDILRPHGIDIDTVRRAFPSGKVEDVGDGTWKVALPHDRSILVRVEPTGIAYNSRAMRFAHPEASGESHEAAGVWQKIPAGGVIRLAKAHVSEGVLGHEVFHSAMSLVLTPKEQAAVLRRFEPEARANYAKGGEPPAQFDRLPRERREALIEEAAADAYAAWKPSETNTLFSKIAEFFRRIYHSFKPSWESAFKEVRSGKAFERKGENADAETRYAAREMSPKGGPGDKSPQDAPRTPAGDKDYRGQHQAPMRDSGAPAHDVTGGGNYYPDDFYGPNAVQYYGDSRPEDHLSISIVKSMRGRPNAAVTIYRAVPHTATNAERIAQLEKSKYEYMRRGKLPDDSIARSLGGSKWYEWASEQIERLKAAPEQAVRPDTFNRGDWVTINRAYAKEHGEGALNGQYKIISKRVRAKDIYTNGDSIHEWGYDPSDSIPGSQSGEPKYATAPKAPPETPQARGPLKPIPPRTAAGPKAVPPPAAKTPTTTAQTPPAAKTFTLPEERWHEGFLRAVQDRFNRVKRIQDAVKDQGGKVDESNDVYRAEELFHGRTETKLTEFREQHIEPLVKAMTAAKVTPEEMGQFLYAAHAPDANAQLARINPVFSDTVKNPGSGMTDADAAKILADFKAQGKLASLEKIADDYVYRWQDERLKRLVSEGLETQETVNAWRKAWGDKYVPLFREDLSDTIGNLPGTGRGFDIRGPESRTRTGSTDKAENPLAYAMAQAQTSIVRAEKNRVGQKLLQFVRDNPDKDLWTVDTPPRKPRVDKKTGMVTYAPDPLYKLNDNVFSVKEGGEEHLITINDPLLARAMKNLGADTQGKVMQWLGQANRIYAGLVTSYSPEFILTNPIRDIQAAATNLTAEQSGKIAKTVVKNVPSAMAGAYNVIRGKGGNGKWETLYKEFREDGGQIGFFGLRGPAEQLKELESLVKNAGPGGRAAAVRAAKGFTDWINDANKAMENAVRLSAYSAMRDSGASRSKAASVAKNLTVNFNRKGELGGSINALYAFFNASVQGTARIAQMLGTRRGKMLATAVAASGYVMDQANRALAGDEDQDGRNDYDQIPEYVKDKNWIVMRGKGQKPLMMPMPYGYNVLHAFGRNSSAMLSGKTKPTQGAANLLGSALGAFNPLGGESDLVQQASPTLFDPVVQHITNRNFAGNPIRPEGFPGGTPKPDSQMAFRSVSPMARRVAEGLNMFTGGDKATPGAVDVSPETIEHVVGFLTGGLGKFVSGATDTGSRLASGEPLPARETPFLKRFVYEPHPSEIAIKYRDDLEELDALEARAKLYRQERNPEKLRSLPAPMLRVKVYVDSIERQIAHIRRLEKRGPVPGADDRVTALQKKAMRAIETARRQAEA